MRDTLTSDRLTCGWTFRKPPLFWEGKELRFGDERLIGISDWTNTSRTFDVIRTVIGNPEIALISSVDRLCRFVRTIGYYTRRLLPSRRLRNAHHSSSASSAGAYVLMKTQRSKASRDSRRETLVAPGIRITGKCPPTSTTVSRCLGTRRLRQ